VRSVAWCHFLLPYYFRARDDVLSAHAIISTYVLESIIALHQKEPLYVSYFKVVIQDFFRIIISIQFFHLEEANPDLSGMRVNVPSISEKIAS
jgi:hypothetical protein